MYAPEHPLHPHRAPAPQAPRSPSVFVLGNHVQAHCLDVARLPRPGESVAATALHSEPGGKGLNVAIGLHRLGCEVSALFPVGQDAAGEALAALLQREGLTRARCVPLGAQSGFGVGLLGADGQNTIAVHLGANALLQAEHVRTLAGAAIEGADWFYAPLELSHDAVRTALELARASGGRTVLNPSPFAPMDAGFWALCDGLVVNESEAQALLGLPTSGHGDTPATSVWSTRQWTGWLGNQPELAWGGHKWSGQWLVVTLADQGAVMWQRGGCVCWEPALNATPVVDTVGCGDAFLCGFLTAWAGTGDAATALRAGNACGAHVAAQRGVLDALPQQAQLAGWLAVDAATHSV